MILGVVNHFPWLQSSSRDLVRNQARHRSFLDRTTKIETLSQAVPKSKMQEDSFTRYFSFLQFLSIASHLNNLVNALVLWQPQIVFLLDIRTHKSISSISSLYSRSK